MSATPRSPEDDMPAKRPALKEVSSPGNAPEAPAAPKPHKRKRARWLMLLLPLLLLAGGGYAWLTGGRYVSTDNAYVHQPIVAISADIAGRIEEVMVSENDRVQAGDPLFRLDAEPFRIALHESDAALAAARLSVEQLRSAYRTAQVKLEAAKSIHDVRQDEYDRQRSLADRGVASSAALDEAEAQLRAAQSDVNLARAGVAAAAAALGGDPDIATGDFPAVRAALARRDEAQRALDHATVTAPVAGIVSQIDRLNVGQYLSPGAQVASIVEAQDSWVEANFKETEIAPLTEGQPVNLDVDAYPGLTLHGTVESIGSATGSQFALIPAENATGNWVKVVQRVPVRISVASDAAHPLRGGMSVQVAVDTGASRLDKLTR